ncbi:hypothetical protein LWI29_036729 [Acer saccharum]|uniref:Uncharacterized protein n=1 Tax=Acer saccharum TaxID=4024 RepID=A0AA39RS49_ACESA|nr:hypothetical protein LWI29_036729 [Acer saccharum]
MDFFHCCTVAVPPLFVQQVNSDSPNLRATALWSPNYRLGVQRIMKNMFFIFPGEPLYTRYSRKEDGLNNHNKGKVSFREKDSTPIAVKGKDKLVYARKSKSRPQLKVVCASTLNLEKRKVGEKEIESSDYDNLSSSDQGIFRGESSKRDYESKPIGLGPISCSTVGLKPGQLFVILGLIQNNS